MGKSKKKKGKMSQAVVRENIQLYLLMLPVFLLIIVFCYGADVWSCDFFSGLYARFTFLGRRCGMGWTDAF